MAITLISALVLVSCFSFVIDLKLFLFLTDHVYQVINRTCGDGIRVLFVCITGGRHFTKGKVIAGVSVQELPIGMLQNDVQ